MIVLCMVSGGFRIGSWNWLDVGDVTFLEGGISRLRIYRGEPEEYFTFVSPEATAAMQEYLDLRRRVGEEIRPDSPLARNRWDFEDGRKKIDARIVRRLGSGGVTHLLFRTWWKSGVRNTVASVHEFKQGHGFRKYFKTNMPACLIHGDLDKELLLGHYMSYHKPTEEHLLEVYQKAVSYLLISGEARTRAEPEETEKKHKSDNQETRLEVLEMKEKLEGARVAPRRRRQAGGDHRWHHLGEGGVPPAA